MVNFISNNSFKKTSIVFGKIAVSWKCGRGELFRVSNKYHFLNSQGKRNYIGRFCRLGSLINDKYFNLALKHLNFFRACSIQSHTNNVSLKKNFFHNLAIPFFLFMLFHFLYISFVQNIFLFLNQASQLLFC